MTTSDVNHKNTKAGLSTRERRNWARKLEEAQEAVETAEAERAKVIADAYAAGIAFAGIENATGLGPYTVRNNIPGARRHTPYRGEGDSQE